MSRRRFTVRQRPRNAYRYGISANSARSFHPPRCVVDVSANKPPIRVFRRDVAGEFCRGGLEHNRRRAADSRPIGARCQLRASNRRYTRRHVEAAPTTHLAPRAVNRGTLGARCPHRDDRCTTTLVPWRERVPGGFGVPLAGPAGVGAENIVNSTPSRSKVAPSSIGQAACPKVHRRCARPPLRALRLPGSSAARVARLVATQKIRARRRSRARHVVTFIRKARSCTSRLKARPDSTRAPQSDDVQGFSIGSNLAGAG